MSSLKSENTQLIQTPVANSLIIGEKHKLFSQKSSILRFGGVLPVVPHILHIVIIFQHFQKLVHVLDREKRKKQPFSELFD